MTPAGRTAYVPGSVRFTFPAHEARTSHYRTWHSPHRGMAWCGECLLCGDWRSGFASREQAASAIARVHARYCHVVMGCHCPQPHLTAALAARIGVTDSYPYELSGTLFAMAGGCGATCPRGRT